MTDVERPASPRRDAANPLKGTRLSTKKIPTSAAARAGTKTKKIIKLFSKNRSNFWGQKFHEILPCGRVFFEQVGETVRQATNETLLHFVAVDVGEGVEDFVDECCGTLHTRMTCLKLYCFVDIAVGTKAPIVPINQRALLGDTILSPCDLEVHNLFHDAFLSLVVAFEGLDSLCERGDLLL